MHAARETSTGTVTFLFTDIEGSTQLWEQHSSTMHAALARHDALLRQAIEHHHGQVFKTVGDAFYAVFAQPQEAVEAAVAAQRALQAELPQIRVRIAVHTGEAEGREGDYFGPALNRVARLLAAGHGGQVLLSRATAEQFRAGLPEGVGLRSLGEHRLRDLPYREAIYQLLRPGLPSEFPPLSTLDVAFRRGAARATVVAAAVLAVMLGLALAAVNQARRADQQRRVAEERQQTLRRHLYGSQMTVAQQAWEVGNVAGALELLDAWRPAPGEEDLRGFEWRYLWGLCQGDQRFTFLGQSAAVNAVGFSPDGKLLASGSDDNTVKLYDVASLRKVGSLKIPSGGFNQLAFSPNGQMIATSDGAGMVRLWDVAARRELATLTGHKKAVGPVVFSPDGKLLASGGNDGIVRLWDVAARRSIAALSRSDRAQVFCLAFSPDGKILAIGGAEKRLELWAVGTRREVGALIGHGNFVRAVQFSPDGKRAATSGWDGTVRLWDLAARREIGRWYRYLPVCVAFSPDGRRLATGSDDGTIRFWDIGVRREAGMLRGHRGGVTSVAFSPDGRFLASGSFDGTARLWEAAPSEHAQVLRTQQGWIRSVAFSPDGRALAAGGLVGGLRLWDVARRRTAAALKVGRGWIYSVAFSPDGHRLAALLRTTHPVDAHLQMWDLGARRLVTGFVPRVDYRWLNKVVFSPDGRTLAAGGSGNSVTLWEAATGREVAALTGHTDLVSSVAFSPDGKTIASGSDDQTVKLWEVATRRAVFTLRGHQDTVAYVAFSPDGKLLASSSFDHTIRLWEPGRGRLVATMEGYAGNVDALAFSPDGRTLAAGCADSSVLLWDVATGQKVLTLKGHTQPATTVAFSPDGSTLASAGADSTIRLWKAPALPETDPLQVVATGGDRTVMLQWRPLPWALGYRVSRVSAGISRRRSGSVPTLATTETQFSNDGSGLVDGRPRRYRVAPLYRDAAGRVAEGPSVLIRATPERVPPGFLGCSINEGERSGSTAFQPSTGLIILRGSGADIWNEADHFYFLSQARTGDFQVTVQALALPSATQEWAQAGLMLRVSLEPGARHVSLFTTAAHGVQYKWRASTDGACGASSVLPRSALKLPITLRLTRRGDTITAEYSRDHGHTFQPAGESVAGWPLPRTLYAGLAITSHDASQTTEAKFRDLRIESRER